MLCLQNHAWILDIALKQLNNLQFVDIEKYYKGKEMNPTYSTDYNKEVVIFQWKKHRENI